GPAAGPAKAGRHVRRSSERRESVVRVAKNSLAAATLCSVCAVLIAARPHAAADPIFVESAAATGLTFTHVNGAAGNYYLPEIMGAGVALLDYDNDGDLDVFLVQGGAIGAPAAPGASACRLFRNDLTVSADGRRTLRFTDATTEAGISVRGYGMGVAVGDYDNDGYQALFVTWFGSVILLHNNAERPFTDFT